MAIITIQVDIDLPYILWNHSQKSFKKDIYNNRRIEPVAQKILSWREIIFQLLIKNNSSPSLAIIKNAINWEKIYGQVHIG